MVAFKGVTVGPLGASSAPLPPAQQQDGRPGEAAGRAGASSSGKALTLEDVDVDLSEVYFLIMHFLSGGPCKKAFTVLWNELLHHKLLPRRYHALYSKLGGSVDQDENDDGLSYPLNYAALVERYPHIEGDHLIKLLKQLLLTNLRSVAPLEQSPSRVEVAARVPTLVGRGAFSLLDSERSKPIVKAPRWMTQFLWPARSLKVNQVNGLTLRQISGGFSGSHRSPSQSSSNYLLLDPPTLVSKVTAQKKILGHRNAVYCAIFDRRGQLVITGSDDRLVKIWSAMSGLCLRGCRGHEGDITDLAVSSCNTMVASASNDCTIRVWRLDGWPLCVLRGHQKPVTQIQFSPHQNTKHHLLSSSDDNTCRIWNVRNSSFCLYVPRPEKDAGSKAASTPPQIAPGINKFVCCAFNGDGSLFVTGSSDKYARVWQAPTLDAAWTEHPLHELDRLEGHANEVNYVQFSGCAAIAKTLTASSFKEVREEQPSTSKTLWFSSSIVTCSRDGSAIIWTPRRRRQVIKDSRNKAKDVKHWKKTFHLKVPNPPLPPQLSRGGGARQRVPTPRGVNMIVWSLDNRFVLAIMDCRICVWNSVDGTLVHCLTGHTKATYVLDVHPFDPRIAMSAGYDGRVIIWDIHKGVPITQFETGDYELVDGNFSPDGTSLVVSDEVGQMHLFAIGDEEKTWKDAKYDQFFLGDYRPLVRDTYGNVLDQETQMPPAERNLQDLLCDASMIPYPEPYQSLYQQLRLGAIGMEWERPVVMLAVGMTDDGSIAGEGVAGQPFLNMTTPERRASRAADPPVFIDDVVDWEPEPLASSEDGSDYSASEDRESQDDGESLRSLDNEEEGGDTEDEVQLRRSSRRNKRKAEDTLGTNSRRKLRRKSRHQVVDYPYERHYERRTGQGRHSRSNGGGTSTGASKQELAPRSKRKAAKRAERMFKRIPHDDYDEDDCKDDDDGDNEDEDEDEDENHDELAIDQMSAFEGANGETLRPPRRGIPKQDDVKGEISAELVPSKQHDECDSHDEGTEQDSALRQNMSGFGEFCRVTRPRSQRPRKMLIKFKNKFAGSDQEVKGAHETQDGPSNDIFVPDNHEMVSLCLPESSSSKPLKKLVVKYPKPSDEIKEPFIPNVGSPNQNDLNEGAHALIGSGLCDMDERYVGSAQDDKRKWEWKKGKAAKRVRLGVSPGETGADEFAVSCDDKQEDSPEWIHGGSRSSQPHLSVDIDEVSGHGGRVRYVSQSPSNSSEPSGMPSSGGLGVTSVPPPANVRRRPRNLLLAESEDESQDARLLDLRCKDETVKCDAAGGFRIRGVHGPDNGKHLVEFRSSAVIRASPMPLPEPGSSDSDVAEHSKLSNGVRGLRVRMKASSVEGNHGMLSGSGDRTQALKGHISEDSGASDCGDHRRSPEGSGSESPPSSPRGKEVDEEGSAEDEDENEDARNQEDEHYDDQVEHDDREDQDDEQDEDGGDENDEEYKCSVSFRVNGTRVWTTTEDRTGSEDDVQSDDLHSLHGGHSLPNGSYTAKDAETVRLGRKAASNRRQMEIAGSTAGNGDAGKMMQTRRMTQMLAGKSVSDQVARSGNVSERRTRRRGEQSQRLTVSNRTRPQRQRKHVDTEPHVDNSDRLYEDRTRVGRRTSARTKPQDAGQNVSPLNGRGQQRDLGHQHEPHIRGGRNQKMRKRENDWLLATKELGMRYVPQLKDEVVYFRQGHEQFLESPEFFFQGNFERPWQALEGPVRAVEFCRIEELKYKVHPKSRDTYCQLLLKFIDQDSDVCGDTFKVILPILKNCPDFIVERKRYDAAMQRMWSTRDHCQVWWWANGENGLEEIGEWWIGRIKAIKAKSDEFPDSPWEKYQVQYRSMGQGDNVENHSPWELYDCGQTFSGLRPQLDERIRSQLLEAINKLESGYEGQDEFGLQELENLIQHPNFVNKIPLPISMKTVKGRLEDKYYHGLEQFNHDLDTIVDNLVMVYGEEGDLPRKLRNLRRRLTKSVSKFNHRS